MLGHVRKHAIEHVQLTTDRKLVCDANSILPQTVGAASFKRARTMQNEFSLRRPADVLDALRLSSRHGYSIETVNSPRTYCGVARQVFIFCSSI